jgi:succinate-semialdehyde dehydrogenase/glutarate-semialdehyde dehydrogenase
VHDEFVERCSGVEREIRLGDPLPTETTMGPLNNEPTAQKMDEHVADALDAARARRRRRRAAGSRPTSTGRRPSSTT